MKRFILLTSILFVVLSCEKENQYYNSECNTIKASISEDLDTKTSLSDGKFTWSAGDELTVLVNYQAVSGTPTIQHFSFSRYTINSSDAGKSSATFTKTSGDDPVTFDGNYLAYHTHKLEGAYGLFTREYLYTTIPSTQKYDPLGPDSRYLAMRACGPSLSNLSFTNATSVLKFTVRDANSSPISVKSIAVSIERESGGFDGNYKSGLVAMGGWMAADQFKEDSYKYDDFTVVGVSMNKTTDSGNQFLGQITITPETSIPLDATGKDFYFVVLPGNHGKISLVITDTNDNKYGIRKSAAFTAVKGTVHAFPAFEVQNYLITKSSGSGELGTIKVVDNTAW